MHIKGQVWRRIYRSYEAHERRLPRALCDIREFQLTGRARLCSAGLRGAITLFWPAVICALPTICVKAGAP